VFRQAVRDKVIADFYEYETEYVKFLAFVEYYYLQPLQARKELCRPHDHFILFSNIKDLLSFHRSHLKKLSAVLSTSLEDSGHSKTCKIGRIIYNLSLGFELYKIYSSNYMDSVAVLHKISSAPCTREFLEVRHGLFALTI
jgi:hypothetical protein